MEQAVSRREKFRSFIAPNFDDSRAKIALWNDPQVFCLLNPFSNISCVTDNNTLVLETNWTVTPYLVMMCKK